MMFTEGGATSVGKFPYLYYRRDRISITSRPQIFCRHLAPLLLRLEGRMRSIGQAGPYTQ